MAYNDKNRFHVRKYQLNLKRDVMESLGGCRCSYCGSTDFVSLGIDHIDGHHPRHLKGRKLYRAIRDGIVDSGDYQVACRFCNGAKSNRNADEFDVWILALVQYRFGVVVDIHPLGI